jgi:hypothetical protein
VAILEVVQERSTRLNHKATALLIDLRIDIYTWLVEHPQHFKSCHRSWSGVSLVFLEYLVSKIVLEVFLQDANVVISFCVIAAVSVFLNFLSEMYEDAEWFLDRNGVTEKTLARVVVDNSSECFDDWFGMNDQFLVFHRPLIEVFLLLVILALLLKTILLLSFALLVDFGKPNSDTI